MFPVCELIITGISGLCYLAKGFNEFDTDIAWRAMMKDAMYPPDNDLNTSYTTRETGTGVAARSAMLCIVLILKMSYMLYL